MPKIILQGYILVPNADLGFVIAALDQHCLLTQAEPGCLVFNVTQSKNNPNRFDVYEEFIDKHAFILHQQRVKTSYWGQVTANVERFYQISE